MIEMKVLIYGAGVLGSYLAHALIQGGNEVSVLARGSRADQLEKDGLVIRHYFQLKTTKDPITVIRTLEADEVYDLIFVVMKYNDFPSVLPILAANQSRHIVMIGNNTDAREMQQFLEQHSETPKHVAFGFQLSGGRRDPERTVAIRSGGQMVLGGLDGPIPFKAELDRAFASARYKLTYLDDMDAWLKNHVILILAMNYAPVLHDYQMNKVARDDKLLREVVAAMGEGFHVLETLGYPLIPAAQASFIRKHPTLLRMFFKLYHVLPVSRFVDGNFSELEALANVFEDWKKEAGVPTPNWDKLQKRLQKKRLAR